MKYTPRLGAHFSFSEMKFQTQDGDVIEVEQAVVDRCNTLKALCTDVNDPSDNTCPELELPTKVFTQVLEFCTSHKTDEPAKPYELPESLEDRLALLNTPVMEPVSEADRKFIDLDALTVLALYKASCYLDVVDLRDLCLRQFASKIKNQEPDQIKAYFGIEPHFSPEEQDLFEKERRWASAEKPQAPAE
jgi:hypothetical protein